MPCFLSEWKTKDKEESFEYYQKLWSKYNERIMKNKTKLKLYRKLNKNLILPNSLKKINMFSHQTFQSEKLRDTRGHKEILFRRFTFPAGSSTKDNATHRTSLIGPFHGSTSRSQDNFRGCDRVGGGKEPTGSSQRARERCRAKNNPARRKAEKLRVCLRVRACGGHRCLCEPINHSWPDKRQQGWKEKTDSRTDCGQVRSQQEEEEDEEEERKIFLSFPLSLFRCSALLLPLRRERIIFYFLLFEIRRRPFYCGDLLETHLGLFDGMEIH